MGLVTRQFGPNAKGSKLTFAEMDNNLYYLQGLGVSAVTFSSSTLTLTNPTGGTLSVNLAADTNTFITAATYNQSTNTVTLTDNTNTNFNAYINAVSGLTVNGILSATTLVVNGVNITGDTYVTGLTFNTSNYNLTIGRNDGVSFTDSLSILASDLTVTGGTYNPNNGIATFTNNTGGTFNVSGFLTGLTDTFVTGGTYSNGTATFTNTSGGTFNVNGFYTGGTDVFVTGGTYSAGTITFINNTGGTFNINGFYTGIPSVQTVSSSDTVTPTSNDNLVVISAQSQSLLIANPTGSWVEGQDIMIRIKDDGSSRSITYDTNYRAIGVTLPTSTSASKTTYLGIIYNSIDNKWDIIGATTEA